MMKEYQAETTKTTKFFYNNGKVNCLVNCLKGRLCIMYKMFLFTAFFLVNRCAFSSSHPDTIETFTSHNINRKTQQILASAEKIQKYNTFLKKRFPQATSFNFDTSPEIDEHQFNHIEPGNWEVTLNENIITYTTGMRDAVCVVFSDSSDLGLAGLVCLSPCFIVPAESTALSDIASFRALEVYPTLDAAIDFVKHNLTQDQFNQVRVSVLSNYFSVYYLSVCNHIKNKGIFIYSLSFPTIAFQLFANTCTYYYDPTKKVCPLNTIAVHPRSGKIFSNFITQLDFSKQTDILIPISVPPLISFPYPPIPPLNSNGTIYKSYYHSLKIKQYKGLIARFFPEATEPPFVNQFSGGDTFNVVQLGTGELALTESTKIYATSGVWECVVLLMNYDQPPYRRIMYHHAWNRGRQDSGLRLLKKTLQKFGQDLPSDYKKNTIVSLISYYLSENLFDLGIYLKTQKFKISHISYHNIVMDLNNDYVTYLDPRSVYRQTNKNFCRFTGKQLDSRKVAFNHLGEIAQEWTWRLIPQSLN